MNISPDFKEMIETVSKQMDPGTVIIMKLFETDCSPEDDLEKRDSINDTSKVDTDPFNPARRHLGGGGGGTGGSPTPPPADDHLIIGDPGILTDLGQYIPTN
jgi:hypothetical protein